MLAKRLTAPGIQRIENIIQPSKPFDAPEPQSSKQRIQSSFRLTMHIET